MPTPLPSISVSITPPGGSPTDYSTYLTYSGAYQQLGVNQNFGRQGDTATIPLVDDWQGRTTPHFYIPALSRIALTDNNTSTNLFAGVVTNPQLIVDGANRNEWSLQCTDYTFYADNAIVQGTFVGQSVDQIIIALTRQANCGITATSTAAGGFITPAPVLTQVNFNWVKLSDAWRRLAQLASSSTPYGWYVDQNLALHFFDSSTALSSGVTLTTTPTGSAGSTTQAHVTLDGSMSYDFDGTTIRNKIIVQGANQTVVTSLTGNPTDTWRADGTQNSWPLRYTVTGSPALTVNSASTSLTVVNAGGAAPSSGWSIQQNNIGQWFLIDTGTPSSGTVIKIWYNYIIPIVAQVNDFPSQTQYTGPNGGVYAEYINDTSLTTTSMALARAQRERTEYAFAAERINVTVAEDFLGWIRAGQTLTFTSTLAPDSQNSFNWGINASFLCISNQVTFGSRGYRTMNLSAVRV
jgi:hypothetical protein